MSLHGKKGVTDILIISNWHELRAASPPQNLTNYVHVWAHCGLGQRYIKITVNLFTGHVTQYAFDIIVCY